MWSHRGESNPRFHTGENGVLPLDHCGNTRTMCEFGAEVGNAMQRSFRWRYSGGRGGDHLKKPDGIPHSSCLHDGMPSRGFTNANFTGCRQLIQNASPALLAGCRHCGGTATKNFERHPLAQAGYRHFTRNSETQLILASQNLNHVRVKQPI